MKRQLNLFGIHGSVRHGNLGACTAVVVPNSLTFSAPLNMYGNHPRRLRNIMEIWNAPAVSYKMYTGWIIRVLDVSL